MRNRQTVDAATREMSGDEPTWTRPATGRESTGLWFRDAIALLMASALVVLLSRSGWVADAQATLVQMGFDPDRGQLLVGMLMAALAAAVARLIAGRSAPPILASLLGFAAVYGGTFLSETRDALKPAADQGTFDPAGWSMTLLALTVAVVVTGWAASVLAGIVRSQLVISWGDLHDLARSRSRRSAKVARPMAVLAVVALLALTGPVLGDMLNFGPQIHMRQTSSMPVGLFGGAPSTAGDLPSTMPGDSGLSIGVSAGATDRARPWEAWRPTGSATLTSVVFPAPWVGGTATTLKASIYLPPGYATGSQRYPVLYEVPWSLYLWEGGLGFPAPMDSLIDSGLVPAQIVVFISEGGGPYPDSECADSFDGREHYESFLVHTVVPYVDATYRTIATPAARALLGVSQGGFCAPNLLFRNPDTFGQAVSFSGYFIAGVASPQTINAWRPFGGNSALVAANSPVLEATHLPADVRNHLFLVVSGSLSDGFYGPQIRAFVGVLQREGIPDALLPDPGGHSWPAFRDQFGPALELVAARQVHLGVFR